MEYTSSAGCLRDSEGYVCVRRGVTCVETHRRSGSLSRPFGVHALRLHTYACMSRKHTTTLHTLYGTGKEGETPGGGRRLIYSRSLVLAGGSEVSHVWRSHETAFKVFTASREHRIDGQHYPGGDVC